MPRHVFEDEPHSTRIESETNATHAEVGSVLRCITNSNPPPDVYKWLHNGKVISTSSDVTVSADWLGENVTVACYVENHMKNDLSGNELVQSSFVVFQTGSPSSFAFLHIFKQPVYNFVVKIYSVFHFINFAKFKTYVLYILLKMP